MRLRFLCAEILTDNENDWFLKLADFETDPFGALIKRVQTLQDQKQIKAISQDDFNGLNELRLARNYWVHQVFAGDYHVTFNKRGEVKKP